MTPVLTPFLRGWRKAKLARRYKDGKVGRHFRHMEFWTKDGTPIPANDRALAGLERHCALILEPMRQRFGACTVMSGYRHYAYNKRIGGASDSRHDWDKHPDTPATDLIFAEGSPEEWGDYAAGLAKAAGIGAGIGKYRRLRFVHVDLRPGAARWRGSGE